MYSRNTSQQGLVIILEKTLSEIITNKKIITFDEDFISTESNFESIEIAQIISAIEDNLKEEGVEGYDLFEKVFEYEKLTLNSLIDLIESDLKDQK